MRFRTRLLIIFLGVALFTNGISLAVMNNLASRNLHESLRAKYLSITESVATMLDPSLLKQVDSEASPAWRSIHETLRAVRNANRRDDTFIKRIFTVMRAPADASVLRILVDSDDDIRTAAHFGETYRGDVLDIGHAGASNDFIKDEFGTFLRSWAPVKDANGEVVGAVIAESSADWIEAKMRPIHTGALLTMLLATLIAIPAALIISRRVSGPLQELNAAVKRIGNADFDTPLTVRSKDEFGEVAAAVNQMALGLKERDRVKTTFAHYVSHQVMDSILKSGAEIRLSGDRRRISVLFCDIRGFTSMSEKLRPEQVVLLLNDYFEAMVEVIFRHNGTLDKFIGDGIMVIFGAPEDDVYQEEHALKAAIEMQSELHKLAVKWAEHGIDMRIGIGINSGPAVVGNIGSSRRMDYTAIGDTVNLASRLESATKELGVGILVSEYTYNAVRGAFPFREMGAVHVKGRTEPVMTYTPVV